MAAADKIKGTVKEVVAEIVGDGKLAEEGKADRREADRPGTREDGDLSPVERLNNLT